MAPPIGNARDRQLRGFEVMPTQNDSTKWATDMLGHFDRSTAAGGRRDYSCPARLKVVRRAASTGGDPYNIGTSVQQGQPGRLQDPGNECYHTTGNMWNSNLGGSSHVGIVSRYSNPGTVMGSAGLKTFPARGHEVTGWYVYRGMADSGLLETAFAPEILAGTIRKIRRDLYHEIGAYWQ